MGPMISRQPRYSGEGANSHEVSHTSTDKESAVSLHVAGDFFYGYNQYKGDNT